MYDGNAIQSRSTVYAVIEYGRSTIYADKEVHLLTHAISVLLERHLKQYRVAKVRVAFRGIP